MAVYTRQPELKGESAKEGMEAMPPERGKMQMGKATSLIV